jgi:hypothetical protein
MDNVPFLIFSEIAVDFWLEDHFTEAQRDPEVEDFVQTSTPVIDLVHVTSKHPIIPLFVAAPYQILDTVSWVLREATESICPFHPFSIFSSLTSQ